MDKLKEKVKKLKTYFLQRPEIEMAFIFGSQAKHRSTLDSDFDLAVYYKPEGKALEWEENKFYPSEDEIWMDVEKIVGIETDLVILNRASAMVSFSALQEGLPIIIKDRHLYWRFYLTISLAAEDFMYFIRDFCQIKQRSSSLSPIDEIRLRKLIDFMETEMQEYSYFKTIDPQIYASDSAFRRNIERWVEIIVNASIDIAKILLGSEKKRIPQTYREVLQELSLLENFKAETAKKLAVFSKLRNILAHEYLDIRYDQIKKFVYESESSYLELLSYVKQRLEKCNLPEGKD